MSLTAGIVGLPNVGKSTLYNAITKSNVLSANYPFATIDANVGIVELKDERLKKIVEVVKPRNVVFASFSFTDIAGLVKGASHGEGLGNQFLAKIREVDAIVEVVRCFDDDDIIHVNGEVNPIDDIETVNIELALADLDIILKRIPKIEKKALMKVDKESLLEYQVLIKAKEALEQGKMLINVPFSENEKEVLKNCQFLTMKPMIYVCNVSEDQITLENKYVQMVRKYAQESNTKVIVISAKIEEEVSSFSDEDKEMFLQELGIEKSGLDQLVKTTYDLLGLATYFTAGEKEAKAWTFKKGMKAPECAGIIHSDFERGFIRAEVISYEDFIKYGSIQKAKEAGKMRSEGKEYVFQDGDIVLFRFNV